MNAFKIVEFTPGDGTRYRIAFAILTGESKKHGGFGSGGSEACFFGFCEGDDPFVAYTFRFEEGPLAFSYYREKMDRFANSRLYTLVAGYRALCALSGRPGFTPQQVYWNGLHRHFDAQIMGWREGWETELREKVFGEDGS